MAEVPNATALKFGYPETLVADYRHWCVLLRPAQATLGALVLVCKSEATAFSAIPEDAHGELAVISRDIENALETAVAYEKINYLMLMMVDPHVHFHVLPRYQGARRFDGIVFPDAGWPAVPALGSAPELSREQLMKLREFVVGNWPDPVRRDG